MKTIVRHSTLTNGTAVLIISLMTCSETAVPIRIGSILWYFPDCLFGEDRRQKQSGARLAGKMQVISFLMYVSGPLGTYQRPQTTPHFIFNSNHILLPHTKVIRLGSYWTFADVISCCSLLDHCLKNYTTLWNIWTYQLLCKKNCTTCVKFYTSCIIFLTQQLVGSYVSQCCVIF